LFFIDFVVLFCFVFQTNNVRSYCSVNEIIDADDETYVAQFSCPTDSDDGTSLFDDDDDNDDIYIGRHLCPKQLSTVARWEVQHYQRSKRSKKKMNAQRQIKTKHVKSIAINSHNKHLYIHHRLFKQVQVDPVKYHYIPSETCAPLYSFDVLRSIIAHYRHLYRSSSISKLTSFRKSCHSNVQFDRDVDEFHDQHVIDELHNYTINATNMLDERSFDDDMIHFLLDMQNRDLYVINHNCNHH
jgi:hypothetical protein